MNVLVKALVPFMVFLVFALARKYMPPAAAKISEQNFSRGDLDARFRGIQWIVAGGMVVVGIIFGVGMHAAFAGLNRYIATSDGQAEFLLWPQSAIWWFFPGFGALTLSWEITLQIWSILGGRQDASLYGYWSNLKAGFDCTRILRWMTILITVPIGILTVLALSEHTALNQEEIRDCGYAFASCKTYRYADARRMTIIQGFRDRDSKLVRRAGILIDFNDGRRWSSADRGDFNSQIDPALKAFLETKIHLPYSYAQAEEDIPRFANQGSGTN